MKIVVNRCFGGYSLSPLAMKRYAELCGRQCYFFIQDGCYDGPYKPVTIEEISGASLFFSAFDIPNPNEALPASPENWTELTLEQRMAHNKLWNDHVISQRPEARTCPKLVQVVEELGDAASGAFAELEVVEIPDDVNWQIDEYDGKETIREKSREW
jgi:hypothetical protein